MESAGGQLNSTKKEQQDLDSHYSGLVLDHPHPRHTAQTSSIDFPHTIQELRMREFLDTHIVSEAYASQNIHRHETLCHSGTRSETLARISAWVKADSVENAYCPAVDISKHTLCLEGAPGSGKSTILNTILCQFSQDTLRHRKGPGLLHFRIRRQVVATTESHKVLPTLIFQLATSSSQANHRTVQLLNALLPANTHEPDFQVRLFLEAIKAHDKKVLVIIDALDEIDKPALLSQMLSRIIRQPPHNLRLLLATRNRQDVLTNLGHDVVQQIVRSIPDEDSVGEVSQLLVARIQAGLSGTSQHDSSSDTWPAETHVQSLNQAAAGSYLRAQAIVDYLLSSDAEQLRASLDSAIADAERIAMDAQSPLYMSLLKDLVDGDADDADTIGVRRAREVLGFIVVAERPLSLGDIVDHLAFDPKVFDVYHFIQLARPVLVPGVERITNLTIPRMHETFRQFITNDRAGPFQIHLEHHHRTAFQRSLELMALHLHFNIYNLSSSFNLNAEIGDLDNRRSSLPKSLVYAYLYWSNHFHNAGPDFCPIDLSPLRILLYEKFLFWLEIVSAECKHLEYEQNRTSSLWSRIAGAHRAEDRELIIFANDALKLLGAFKRCIGDSIPHIYISLLAFSPTQSLVSRHYRMKLSAMIIPPPFGKPRDWDSWDREVQVANPCGVSSTSFSPCSHYIATGYSNGSIRVWDVEYGNCLRGPWMTHSSKVTCVSFSPDGSLIASASNDRKICVRNSTTGVVLGLNPVSHPALPVLSISFSPDSTLIASGSEDGTIRVWDIHTSYCVLGPLRGHVGSVYSLLFSGDGSYLTSTSRDQTIRLWDASSGQQMVGPLKGHKAAVISIAHSPDGRHIASGSDDSTVMVWSVQSGTCVRGPFRGHCDTVVGVAFSTDSRYVTSVSNDQSIRIWDLETGACRLTSPIRGSGEAATCAAFSPDRKYLATGSQEVEAFCLLNLETLLSEGSSCLLYAQNTSIQERPIELAPADNSNWAKDSQGRHLYWAPRTLNDAAWGSSTLRILGRPSMMKPDLSRLITGEEWLHCL